MTADNPTAPKLAWHVRTLGICWVLYGILCLVMAVWLVFFETTATVMFGALLNRVPDPFRLMDFFHFTYGLVVALAALRGILGILAGGSLLAGSRSGRMLALVAAFLSLCDIPLGTTLGIYSLVVLLTWTSSRSSAVVSEVQIPQLKRQTSPM